MAEVTASTYAPVRTHPHPSAVTLRAGRAWIASPYAALFALLFIGYTYVFPRWADWNQNSRFDLTRAVVEQRTTRIDAYVANTGDYAVVDGHAYSDKAPGLSLAAVPIYAVTHLTRPLGPGLVAERLSENDAFAATLNPDGNGTGADRVYQAAALYLATIACVTVPAALMGVLLALVVERLAGCRTAGILSALIVGFATPIFTYSQAFYGHLPAAACIVAALAIVVLRQGDLSDRAVVAVGFLLGLAVLIEYPSALAGLPVGLLCLARAGRRALWLGPAGAIVPLSVLAIYDLIAFGTPLPVGYEHSALWQEQHQTGFLSLTHPTWDALWGLTGGSFRGLFFFAPVLLLAIPGAVLGLRSRRARAETLAAVAAFLGMLLFAASSVMWWGGFAVGPRYILPAVPLLAIPLGVAIARVNRVSAVWRAAGMLVIIAVGGVSAGLTWAMTLAGQSYPPDSIAHPLGGYALPALRDGDIARNLGMALGLHGLASLVPLAMLLASGLGMLLRRLATSEPATA